MNLLIHLIFSILIAILLFFFGVDNKNIFIFITASILIDLDHLFFWISLFSKNSLKETIKIAKKFRKNMIATLFIFHSPEFNFLLLVSSFFNILFLFIFLGSLIHISFDIYEHYIYYENFKFIRKWSIVCNIEKIITKLKKNLFFL